MSDLSIFADESGDRTGRTRHYLLTLVFHNQKDSIEKQIERYEQSIRDAGLPNIPFHSEPLLNGHGSYASLDLAKRKKLLNSFGILVQRLPIRYKTFAYQRKEYEKPDTLSKRMERDIRELILNNLQYFQSFDAVKIYYDNGQDIVKQALRESIEFALSKNAVHQRRTTMSDFRLQQVSDFLCTIELAAIKYDEKESGETYNKFFGGKGKFKKNWLKQARRKALN